MGQCYHSQPLNMTAQRQNLTMHLFPILEFYNESKHITFQMHLKMFNQSEKKAKECALSLRSPCRDIHGCL